MKRIVALLLAVLGLFALTACSGGAAALDPKLPSVVGMVGNDARDKLKDAGYDVDFDAGNDVVILAGNWTVDAQTPAAGQRLASGEKVTLKVHKTAAAATPTATDTAAASEATATPEATASAEGDRSDAYVQLVCDRVAKAKFPYGYKAHWILGHINAEHNGKRWFEKVEVTITNAYGAERDAVIECTTKGGDEDPEVVSLNVY